MFGAIDVAEICACSPSFEIDAFSYKLFGNRLSLRGNVCRNVYSSWFKKSTPLDVGS